MKTYGRYLWLVLLLGFTVARAANAGEPLDVIKGAAERALQVLKDPKLLPKDKRKERVERLKEIVDPVFDYEEMAKRTLGAHWRRRTPAEQQEFVKLFHDFIEKVYSDKIDLYEGEKIVFGRETVDQDFAQVESNVINVKGETYAMVYRMRRADGKWKVYDTVLENISIVNNYRSQFDRVITTSSFEELLKRLREKAG